MQDNVHTAHTTKNGSIYSRGFISQGYVDRRRTEEWANRFHPTWAETRKLWTSGKPQQTKVSVNLVTRNAFHIPFGKKSDLQK